MKLYLTLLFFVSIAVSATVYEYIDNTGSAYAWKQGWMKSFKIHESCNATQYNQLAAGLQDTIVVAQHARDHTLRYGRKSPFFKKYFGKKTPTAPVIGVFGIVADGDKSDLLFRCDDPDDKCRNEGWGGYWRGENGTNENNICDLSFLTRQSLPQMCSQGYTVTGSKASVQWSGDLLHRLFHTQSAGEDQIDHYADSYEDILELVAHNTSYTVKNTGSLILYAMDVYAFDLTVPGVGCNGDKDFKIELTDGDDEEEEDNHDPDHDHDDEHDDGHGHDHDHGDDPTKTEGSSCHTHADGEVHCA
ncbi:PRA1 [[Candida] subhashii]|uniref:PRA1 n=1 Tax=[Candida] subhashii TaxID=561895 RepID=A0A8J5URC9_9ASCO|nr:PRA1 [[Candida] subhashii]KAG7664502.1 PRA1 [[Candida] subhashii]